MAKDPYRYFRIEARELLSQLSKGVLDLEKANAGAEAVMRLLRLAHTLKGAARVVKQAEIAESIHRVEDMIDPYRDGTRPMPHEQVDGILNTLDGITDRLAQLPLPDSTEVKQDIAAVPAALPESAVRIVRADVVEVDVLLEGLGEIGSELAELRHAIASMQRIRHAAALLAPSDPSSAKSRAATQDIQNSIVAVERNLTAGIERMDRELDQARDAAERLRLVPVARLFNALERAVRDAAHSAGKKVRFEAGGGEVRIDGEVFDAVQGALVQLVRNAVAHGIEPEAQRSAAGKPAEGCVSIGIVRRGYQVWFRCTDDGCGVDLEAIRRTAMRRGASSADTQQLDATQLLALLLQGGRARGMTTAGSVTELSGRGIGLDVVREAMQILNGEVVASTMSGNGTTIELRVPLSLASLDVLIAEADEQTVALPLDAVKGTLRIAPDDIVHTANGDAILYEEELVPFIPMAPGLRQKHLRSRTPQLMNTVIVASDDTNGMNNSRRTITALAVTRLHGVDTVVLRPLPKLAMADPMVLGMHFDTEGNPCMVLDPDRLIRTLQQDRVQKIEMPQTINPILVIDDSLTTRMLESSILESAGFEVALASSAEEGLDMAKRRRYALFLVDVEMPGMDGFGFIECVHADPLLCDVPCVLVTSRDSPEDRRRGASVGARAHIIKNEFDQVEFLRHVTELVQR